MRFAPTASLVTLASLTLACTRGDEAIVELPAVQAFDQVIAAGIAPAAVVVLDPSSCLTCSQAPDSASWKVLRRSRVPIAGVLDNSIVSTLDVPSVAERTADGTAWRITPSKRGHAGALRRQWETRRTGA